MCPLENELVTEWQTLERQKLLDENFTSPLQHSPPGVSWPPFSAWSWSCIFPFHTSKILLVTCKMAHTDVFHYPDGKHPGLKLIILSLCQGSSNLCLNFCMANIILWLTRAST